MEKLESRWPRHEARGCEGQRKGIERKNNASAGVPHELHMYNAGKQVGANGGLLAIERKCRRCGSNRMGPTTAPQGLAFRIQPLLVHVCQAKVIVPFELQVPNDDRVPILDPSFLKLL